MCISALPSIRAWKLCLRRLYPNIFASLVSPWSKSLFLSFRMALMATIRCFSCINCRRMCFDYGCRSWTCLAISRSQYIFWFKKFCIFLTFQSYVLESLPIFYGCCCESWSLSVFYMPRNLTFAFEHQFCITALGLVLLHLPPEGLPEQASGVQHITQA